MNYQFGARTLFPEGHETVYVPVFDSSSYRRELGEELTEAVIKEIERRSRYKVVSSPSADTVLRARSPPSRSTCSSRPSRAIPARSEVDLAVKVSWVDRAAKVREIPLVPVPAAAVDISAASTWCPRSASRSQQPPAGHSTPGGADCLADGKAVVTKGRMKDEGMKDEG